MSSQCYLRRHLGVTSLGEVNALHARKNYMGLDRRPLRRVCCNLWRPDTAARRRHVDTALHPIRKVRPHHRLVGEALDVPQWSTHHVLQATRRRWRDSLGSERRCRHEGPPMEGDLARDGAPALRNPCDSEETKRIQTHTMILRCVAHMMLCMQMSNAARACYVCLQ